LQGTDRPEFDLADWDVSELKGIKVVADKYDMPTVPRLLAECLGLKSRRTTAITRWGHLQ
jgi:hypothetical protein